MALDQARLWPAGFVEHVARDRVRGWVYGAAGSARVELWLDGRLVAAGIADEPRADLAAANGVRLGHAFTLVPPAGARIDLARFEVRAGDAVLALADGAARREGVVERAEDGWLSGWAWQVGRPDRPATLALRGPDGATLGHCVADLPRRDLADAGIGDGRHGFLFDLAMLPPGARAGRGLRGRGLRGRGLRVVFDDDGTPLPDLASLPAAEPIPGADGHPAGVRRVTLAPPSPCDIVLTAEAVEAMRSAIGVARPGQGR